MDHEEARRMMHDLLSEPELEILEKGGISVSDNDQVDDGNGSDDEYDRRIMEAIAPNVGAYGGAELYAMPDGERGVLEERYKFENHYLQLQLANQKAEFYKKAGELEKAIERLRREKRDAETKAISQKKESELRFIQQKEITREEIQRVRDEHGELGREAPLLQDKIASYKNGLKNLLVSEDKYLEIRSIPETKRNIKEFVQVKAYELTRKLKEENEGLRREIEDLRERNLIVTEQYKKESREMDRVSNILRDRENDYTNRIEDLEIRNKELQEGINQLRMHEERYKVKERDYDSVKERLRELEKANNSLQVHAEIQSETVQKVNNQREEYEKQYDNLKRQIDLLNQDKTFMERENASLHDRIRRLETDVERVEDQREKQYAEMIEAKKQAQNYLERLLNNQGEFGSTAHK